jgi:hypothetical protein
MLQIPFAGLRMLALTTSARGAVSGFGLVHLIWGAHDVDAWWRERRARGREATAPGVGSPSS